MNNNTKIVYLLYLYLFSLSTDAQDERNQSIINNSTNTLNRLNEVGFGSTRAFVNSPRKVEGSIYMFDKWNNIAIVQTKNKKRVVVKNVNLDLQRNRIISKYGKDSLFVFNMNLLDKIIINGKEFRKLELDNRVYEVVFKLDKITLLNFHHLKILEGSTNPMVNRKADRFKHIYKYHLLIDGNLHPIKLNRKEILNVLTKNDLERRKIKNYYNTNKFSYKSIDDLKKVLNNLDNII